MRKSLVVAVVLMVAAGLAAPAAGEPNLRREESASANWMVPTGEKNHFTWYGAHVWRNTVIAGAEGWFSFAGFVKGTCVREVHRRSTVTSCRGRTALAADADRDFEISPAADGATLRAEQGGRTFKVTWTASEPLPSLYGSQEYCFDNEGSEGQGTGGGMWRHAHTVGRLFGHRFGSADDDGQGYLSTGAMVSECSFRSYDYDPSTGAVRATFRTPR